MSLHAGERHLRTPPTGHSRTSAPAHVCIAGQCLRCCSQGNRISVSWSSEGGPHEASLSYALCTTRVHELDKRVLNLPTFSQMPHNGYLVRLLACSEIAHLCLFRVNRSAAGISNELLGLSDHAVLGARAFLHSDSRASRHDRWAQLLLCVCDAGFQNTSNCVLGTSPLSLLRRTPKPGSAENVIFV